jgi:hypothetical protein
MIFNNPFTPGGGEALQIFFTPPTPEVRYVPVRNTADRELLERQAEQIRQLSAELEGLRAQQQQQPVQRRRWYRRLVVLETWGDDDRA